MLTGGKNSAIVDITIQNLLGEAPRRTQAAALKCRETPLGYNRHCRIKALLNVAVLRNRRNSTSFSAKAHTRGCFIYTCFCMDIIFGDPLVVVFCCGKSTLQTRG